MNNFRMLVIWFFLLTIKCSLSDDNDLFSSTADLTRMMHVEDKFVKGLKELLDKLEKDVSTIKEYLTNFSNLDLTQE